MGKRRAIRLDTRFFAKSGDGVQFFSRMLKRHAIGDVVTGDDAADLMALLKRHDEFEEKVGAGVSGFKVAMAPDGHEGKCFWIVRCDGSKIDFSFKHCLQAKPSDGL